jgi:lactoylglutathione lyase
MKLGYTILYVRDVEASLNFFEIAFGLSRRFYHESGYGEVETGVRCPDGLLVELCSPVG